MKQQFIDIKFSPAKTILLNKIDRVIVSYQKMGYKLTLRQLYYQLVAKGTIPNTVKEYGKLSDLLTNARMAGLVDWSAIEDRGRKPHTPSEWQDLESIMDSVNDSFRLPRWENQPLYVELWTEKDALTSILEPITKDFHIPLVVNKGYSSASAMYAASLRFREATRSGKQCVLLYLGDHDPSGIDMDRDIRERMKTFRADVIVRPIGLTMEQIEELNPPENPAKVTDPRAKKYIERHGDISWEVDAIPPEALDRLVRGEIRSCTNMEYYEEVKKQEDTLKEWLTEQISGADEYTQSVKDNLEDEHDPAPPEPTYRDEQDEDAE
jgi:hypothetical protein